MIHQFTVDVSVLLDELITKLVPATINAVGADKTPGVPPTVFVVRNIFELAVTAVVLTVVVPATIAELVPIDAFVPVAIDILFPAVGNDKLPLIVVEPNREGA